MERVPGGPFHLAHQDKNLSEWISFEILEGEKTAPLLWPIEPAKRWAEKQRELTAERLHLEYVVPESETQKIDPGEYTIRARLDSGLSGIHQAEILLPPATVRVLSAEDAGEGDILQNTYLAGNFYLSQKDYGRAERCARDILGKDARNVHALILMGAVYEGKGDLEKARRTYQDALNIFAERHPDEPPPEILLKKIGFKE